MTDDAVFESSRPEDAAAGRPAAGPHGPTACPRSARCRRGTLTVMYFDEIPVTFFTDYAAQLKHEEVLAPAELAQKIEQILDTTPPR